ncbi:MAG TPA: hypothetical protein VH083_23710, partial [Myxococcales bacterium]|nr:hypothetical protein [Myxococcales bacterium]
PSRIRLPRPRELQLELELEQLRRSRQERLRSRRVPMQRRRLAGRATRLRKLKVPRAEPMPLRRRRARPGQLAMPAARLRARLAEQQAQLAMQVEQLARLKAPQVEQVRLAERRVRRETPAAVSLALRKARLVGLVALRKAPVAELLKFLARPRHPALPQLRVLQQLPGSLQRPALLRLRAFRPRRVRLFPVRPRLLAHRPLPTSQAPQLPRLRQFPAHRLHQARLFLALPLRPGLRELLPRPLRARPRQAGPRRLPRPRLPARRSTPRPRSRPAFRPRPPLQRRAFPPARRSTKPRVAHSRPSWPRTIRDRPPRRPLPARLPAA